MKKILYVLMFSPMIAMASPWSVTSVNEKEMGLLNVASYEKNKEKGEVSFTHRMLLVEDGRVEVEKDKFINYQTRESELVFNCKKNTFSVSEIKFLVDEKVVHKFPGVTNIKAQKANPIYGVACGKEIDNLKKHARVFDFNPENIAKLRDVIKQETPKSPKK